jgi:hypothetical protein
MGRIRGEPKNVLLTVRVTPRIREHVLQEASREGLVASEWLRNLIVIELKKSNALPISLREPYHSSYK